jgi:hypothetical protein
MAPNFPSVPVVPQRLSSAPVSPKLRLATAMSLLALRSLRVEATQSMPQTVCAVVFCSVRWSKMRTAHSRAPGATPTRPIRLSSAPMNPATMVPWPSESS